MQQGSGDFNSNHETVVFEKAFDAFLKQQNEFVTTMAEGLAELAGQTVENSTQKQAPETPQAVANPKLKPMTILVVEPVELYRVLLGRWFQARPVNVEFARLEDEAQAKLEAQTFDHVVRDWGQQIRQGVDRQSLFQQIGLN
jgi:PleD family two-component response regulator